MESPEWKDVRDTCEGQYLAHSQSRKLTITATSVDMAKASRKLAVDLRNPPISSRPNLIASMVINPLREFLVPNLMNRIFGLFRKDGDTFVSNIRDIVEGSFEEVEIEDENEQQKAFARQILQSESDRFVGLLRVV